MAQIYNSELTKELRDGIKGQTSRDLLPSQIADKVVPVLEVNPKMLKFIEIQENGVATNATSAAVVTLSPSKDFYLCAAELSLIKDVTSTSTLSKIDVVFAADNKSHSLCRIAGITLTAQADQKILVLPRPIKLQRGSNIAVTNSTNVANITAIGTIYGYYDESSNA